MSPSPFETTACGLDIVPIQVNKELDEAAPDIAQEPQLEFTAAAVDWDNRQFTCFPKLPLDCKLMIWNEAMPDQRILETFCKTARFTYDHFNNVMYYEPSRIIIKNEPPTLLFVNQESRAEALKRYTLRLDTEQSQGCGWIDPIQDVVYFPWAGDSTRDYGIFDGSIKIKEGVLSQIYCLAIDSGVVDVLDKPESANYNAYLRALSEFRNLKEFIVVLHSPNCKYEEKLWHRDLSFRPPKYGFLWECDQYEDERGEEIIETFENLQNTFGPEYEAPEVSWTSLNLGISDCCDTEEERRKGDSNDECYMEEQYRLSTNPYGYGDVPGDEFGLSADDDDEDYSDFGNYSDDEY